MDKVEWNEFLKQAHIGDLVKLEYVSKEGVLRKRKKQFEVQGYVCDLSWWYVHISEKQPLYIQDEEPCPWIAAVTFDTVTSYEFLEEE